MAYPGPPGVSSSSSHPNLPPRPPPSKLPPSSSSTTSSFKPAFSAAPQPSAISYSAASAPPGYPSTSSSYASYSAAPSYGAAPPPTTRYGAAPPSSATYAQPPIGGGRGGNASHAGASSYDYGQGYSQQGGYYGSSEPAGAYSAAPQIRNPFPAPVRGQPVAAGDDYDPEMAAQVAQWQSAYMPKDSADAAVVKGPGGRATAPVAANFQAGVASADALKGSAAAGEAGANATTGGAAAAGNERKKTVYREGGGKKWADDSLLEWDPAHLRLFVGNLAGEVTDDSLLKAFARWRSVQKAKVVRDKRTSKSKGFGFVSFSDPDDFFQAAKEMNGKYIQSHPVVVRKSTTEIRPQGVKEKGNKNYKKGGAGNKNGHGMGRHDGGGGGYEPHLGPAGGGVTKPGQKTKGGLKLLG